MRTDNLVMVLAVAVAAGTAVVAAAESKSDGDVRFSRVRLATGVELQVAEKGPADGQPVLFLHGYTDSWFSFSPVLDRLPAGIRAIVPSQRGHGDSERPACCYGSEDFARDAAALLDALGIERADVVGHSMGSFAAQRLAIDFPERVGRLVLLGSGDVVKTPVVVEFSMILDELTDPVAREFAHEFQVSTAHVPLPPAFLERAVDESMKLPAHVWRGVNDGMHRAAAENEISRIRAQTLVLGGAHDGIWTRANRDALAAAIPGARHVTYPHLGHALHWEDPDRVAADVFAFLRPQRGQ
jgi:pimeloyl-ACP methyl ester carboxylesterase